MNFRTVSAECFRKKVLYRPLRWLFSAKAKFKWTWIKCKSYVIVLMPACIELRGLPKSQALIEGGGVIGDPVKFCTFRIFACAPCKFPFSANARSGFLGWGWGGGGVGCNDMHWTCTHVRCYAIVLAHMFDATQLHLRTCSMLRKYCTCAHVRCYAIVLAHIFDATKLHLHVQERNV